MAKVTISDIAERAGVSRAAASFAFNDPARLSTSIVDHILRVADELGYTRNPVAWMLSTRRTPYSAKSPSEAFQRYAARR